METMPAIAWCDFIEHRPLALLGAVKICDRPICAEHRRLVGHMCDRSRRTKNNHSDTIDYCVDHLV